MSEKAQDGTIYRLYGKTYDIKEELKALGCHWDGGEKCWETPYMEKDEFMYKRISSLVEAFGVDMVPVKLSKECSKIQQALRGISNE